MVKTLIIDDEKLSRELIKAYLKPYTAFCIIGECENGFEGLKAIQEHKPDLIFLDVQMPKLSGFEMLELLENIPVIIFSTAFDQYALKAFELSAADYLLKPYSEQRFKEALEKATQKIGVGEYSVAAGQIVKHKRDLEEQLERVVVRMGSKIVIIPIQKIELIKAEDDFVEFYREGKKYLKQMTMKYLTNALPVNQFVRVHRSYIVNIDQINRLEAYSKDSYIAILKNGEKVPVSRSGYGALKAVLNF